MSFRKAASTMRRARMFTEARNCALCNGNATDFHHIINCNRIAVKAQEDIPEEFTAPLCNNCNCNRGKIGADTWKGRQLCILHNRDIYGAEQMNAALDKFAEICLDKGVLFIDYGIFKGIINEF